MGRPERALISRDRAARAALDVIDAKGLSSVSLELVARQLGVKAPSLYYHFKDKNELLCEVALTILRDIRTPSTDFSDWDKSMLEVCVATRRAILLHPNAAPLLLEVFPRKIFTRAYEFWIAKCPYPVSYHLMILEGTEKITYGTTLFAAASRSRATIQMPELDKQKYPALASAVRSNDKDEEALFVAVITSFLKGIKVQVEADVKRSSLASK